IDKLFVPDPNQELQYVMNAVSTIKKGLNGRVPLIGFSGSPWTLACYMVEGSGSKNFARIKRMMYDTPELMHRLLDIVSQSVISYLQAQIESGADIVMVFDTWGGNLSTNDYETFSLAYSRKISDALIARNPNIPRTLFTKGAGVWLKPMANAGYSGLGVDWTTDLKLARELTQDKVILQGNLDPTSLYASPETIRQKVRDVLADYGHGHKHIFNLGHGILPDINPEHVAAMFDEVHVSSPAYHG
ncbi:MAG: uroporphyrinogen decarboxylase, partial [Piscirickettsiaceae bacterium]